MNNEIPQPVSDLCMRCLTPEPEKRLADAAGFEGATRQCQRRLGRGRFQGLSLAFRLGRRRFRFTIGTSAVALLLVVALGWLGFGLLGFGLLGFGGNRLAAPDPAHSAVPQLPVSFEDDLAGEITLVVSPQSPLGRSNLFPSSPASTAAESREPVRAVTLLKRSLVAGSRRLYVRLRRVGKSVQLRLERPGGFDQGDGDGGDGIETPPRRRLPTTLLLPLDVTQRSLRALFTTPAEAPGRTPRP